MASGSPHVLEHAHPVAAEDLMGVVRAEAAFEQPRGQVLESAR